MNRLGHVVGRRELAAEACERDRRIGQQLGKTEGLALPFDEIVGALGELGGGALIGFVLRLHREAKLEHRLLAEGAALDVAARNGAVLPLAGTRDAEDLLLGDLIPAVDLDFRDLVAEVASGLKLNRSAPH